MEQSFGSRLKHAWNVFRSRDPTAEFGDTGASHYNRPDRPRFTRGNERSITTSVLNRIALDASAIDILHVPEEKISVIYHGVSISNSLQLKPVVDGDYFLFVGRRNGYKNFLPMVKAMAPYLKSHPSFKLVCTANDFNSSEMIVFRELGISHQIRHVFASYVELLSLYKYAKAFIYPSLYEGFGIPILEAYAMKCPVLLSKESCFPEIAGDAALYFKLTDQENTLSALLEQFTNMSQIDHDSLIGKQNERLKRYSWEKSALQLAEVYESVLNERKE